MRSTIRLALPFAALAALAGCNSVADWDCSRIAEKSVEISRDQPVTFAEITDVREISRNETDARCEGTARLADGSEGTLYMRAYEEGSNIMVAYQTEPFP